MATEYKLSYTATEINRKLGKIDDLETAISEVESSIPIKTSDLTNDSGYLTTIPSEYVTETELNNKGYLTEHQDLSGYALKSNVSEVKYYIDLSTAITDINNGVTTNALSDVSVAKVKVFIAENGRLTVMLLDDVSESVQIDVNQDIDFVLNGKKLCFTTATAFLNFAAGTDCKINGKVAGSAIETEGNLSGTAYYLVKCDGKSLSVKGGTYTAIFAGTSACMTFRSGVAGNALALEDCTVTARNTTSGAARGIQVTTDDELLIDNCSITAWSALGDSIGVFNKGVLTMCNSKVVADARGDEEVEPDSVGVDSFGTATLINTSVFGTRDAVSNRGKLYVNGGTFTGYSHGGFYFSHGAEGAAYVKDAVIRCANYEGEFTDLFPSDTTQPVAGFYVGTESNKTIYIDGCTIGTAGYTAFVMRNSSGETNNTVNISNSTIVDGCYQVRIDGETHKLNIGVGTNITTDMINNPQWAEFTGEVYRKLYEDEIVTSKDYDVIIEKTDGAVKFDSKQALTEEQRARARENIGVPSYSEAEDYASTADPDRHAEYFTITDDGVVSLKAEYRGATNKADYANDVSDMGVGVAGSKNAELPKHLVIPEIVDGKAVHSLALAIFRYNNAVVNVTLPNTITEIPERCFDGSNYLENVYNTGNIKSIGKCAFQTTAISRLNCPNLEQIVSNSTFQNSKQMVYIDLGKVTTLPDKTFNNCQGLNMVRSENGITSVGSKCFELTPNLKHADFISNLTNIGQNAFLRSGVDYDWSTLTGCTFGTNATPLQYNPTDFWSACTFTPCVNSLPTHLSQQDTRWADREIGTSGVKYSGGCVLMAIMHCYCGLHGITLSSVTEFEEIVNSIDADWLNSYTQASADQKSHAEDLGLTVDRYGGFVYDESGNSDNTIMQTVYDALAAGKYVMIAYNEPSVTGHVVVAYGVNDSGDLLIADSNNAYTNDGKQKPLKYTLPISKLRAAAHYDGYNLHIVSL